MAAIAGCWRCPSGDRLLTGCGARGHGGNLPIKAEEAAAVLATGLAQVDGLLLQIRGLGRAP